jgi:pyruvate,orthophosphate dikinase
MQIARIDDVRTASYTADEIGAKAANLARMAALGLSVPPAFVLPIELCGAIVGGDAHAESRLIEGIKEGIGFLENRTGRRFGDRRRPLLVSVRSGAARSMPGMLDTVLNVGCTSTAVQGLVRLTGNPRFAWDCRCRFLESYGQVVLEMDAEQFAMCSRRLVADEGGAGDRDLDGEALERLSAAYAALIEGENSLPDDGMEQLVQSCRAVYRSWMSERACAYRRLQSLDHLLGTAVTVQAMVFGNRSLTSGSGVAFSRNPSTGAAQPVIEVLFEAQGEDVVSGRRTPETEEAITSAFPRVAAELHQILGRLEGEFTDVQDVEFTIEDGQLWILQTRPAKRTPLAALRIAIDLVHEDLITPQEAIRRIEGLSLATLGKARLADAGEPVGQGVGASSGIGVGRVAFDSGAAERLAASGDPVLLVRPNMSTSDIAGFAASVGIVTALGGRTAHAALVARQMAKPCIVSCKGLRVETAARRARLGDAMIAEGDWISIDGDSGAIFLGRRRIVTERPDVELAEVQRWRAELDSHHRADASGIHAASAAT